MNDLHLLDARQDLLNYGLLYNGNRICCSELEQSSRPLGVRDLDGRIGEQTCQDVDPLRWAMCHCYTRDAFCDSDDWDTVAPGTAIV